MRQSKYQRMLMSVLLLGSAVLFSGCGFKSSGVEGYKVSLEVWGVFDDSDAYASVIGDYKKLNPFIQKIEYRKLSPETYKEDLINAFAAGKGPDIFMIRNAWRAPFEDKLAAAPAGVLSEKEYRDAFADVVATDFIGTENKIFGVPLSVDSLALYYNKDIFNAAGITKAPETWDEIAAISQKLTTLDQFGNITRSGIALGTGANINRSSDILAAMMLQLGAKLRDPNNGRSDLTQTATAQAFEYYNQFARIASPNYSWNARQHYSIDAFYEGTAAMMINYSWQNDTIVQKNAKLNIGVAKLPQFKPETPVNTANYWGYAVSKKASSDTTKFTPSTKETVVSAEAQNAARVLESWQFLKYLTLAGAQKSITLTNGLVGTSKEFPLTTDPSKTYLDKLHKPAARRDLIAMQQSDLVLSAFANGNLIAKSWYQGDPEAMDGILVDMIDSVGRGEKTLQEALATATNRINLLTR
ncbi:MAG: extracellular solute-binding protein [Candidatus Moranbacteria bacterium]|nr:extracellular solute-binding protein [Candidatus Moranbacteria bacterium]